MVGNGWNVNVEKLIGGKVGMFINGGRVGMFGKIFQGKRVAAEFAGVVGVADKLSESQLAKGQRQQDPQGVLHRVQTDNRMYGL